MIPQKGKSRNACSGFFLTPISGFERDLAPLFLPRRLLRFLLGRFLLRLRFFRLFLRSGFLLGRLLRRFLGRRLGRWFWRGRFFLGLLADNHQILFLGFDDLFRFARQLLVIFQPRQLVVVFEIVLLEIHSILPWENLWPPFAKGVHGSLFWPELPEIPPRP